MPIAGAGGQAVTVLMVLVMEVMDSRVSSADIAEGNCGGSEGKCAPESSTGNVHFREEAAPATQEYELLPHCFSRRELESGSCCCPKASVPDVAQQQLCIWSP